MSKRPPFPDPEDSATALRRAARLRETGDAAGAATVYQTLVKTLPREARLWAMLGDALRDAGDPIAGADALETASMLAPDDDAIAVEWALALLESDRAEDALRLLSARQNALNGSERAQAVFADAYRTLGRPEEAIGHYRKVLTLAPRNNSARISLGICLQQTNDLDAAIEIYRAAVQQDPDAADALTNLGLALAANGEDGDAQTALERAVALDGKDPAKHCNLGVFLQNRGDIEAAASCFERAIAAAPDDATAWSNLGNVRQDELRLDEARAAHDRAVSLAPDNADLHWNRAMTLLLSGDFTVGFEEYEWRAQTANHAPPQHESPLWDGSDPNGRRLLLIAEQGFGDAIQFIRYAPLLRRRGAEIVLQCHSKLTALFATLDGDPTIVETGSPPPPVDAHVPLMSLPHLLETTLDTVPADIPYLRLPPDIKPPPRPDRRHRIGLCWTGNPDHPDNPHRSCPVEAFDPVLARGDIDWRSLQFGAAAADASGRIADDATWTACLDGFANTAAALQSLDLVITVDTATAHLAGALGRPVWLMLKYAPDWRWMTGRDDSPWYPTMRLFRQQTAGDWTDVIARIETSLQTWMDT